MRKELDLRTLEERAEKARHYLLTWQKEHYHYARELGFSTYEALILQNHRKEVIEKLAKERTKETTPLDK